MWPRRRRRGDHVKFKFIFCSESLTSGTLCMPIAKAISAASTTVKRSSALARGMAPGTALLEMASGMGEGPRGRT